MCVLEEVRERDGTCETDKVCVRDVVLGVKFVILFLLFCSKDVFKECSPRSNMS